MATPLTLLRHAEPLAIHRLPPTPANISACTTALLGAPPAAFRSLTVTPEEVSLILPTHTPAPRAYIDEHKIVTEDSSTKTEAPWAAFQVAGTLDFALVGILARLVAPLKQAGISVFVVSTFDTDWVLVNETNAARASEVWIADGIAVEDA
ncbi:hypothetical protein HDU86_003718 [Geranomyces michiganensis]|nr:hypothetical protein HDU86_003718 [Geranomyces michiganensis]